MVIFFKMNEIFEDDIFSPQGLINCLKQTNNLDSIYQKQVRHYKLEHHTLLVMNQFEKYFSCMDLPISKNLFRLMLALHDIGKPQAFIEGNIKNQYKYTVNIINELRGILPFREDEIDLLVVLVSSDVLGMYLQYQINKDNAFNQIVLLAAKTNLTSLMFFELLTVYYQCDIAAYTKEAGGLAYLEHLFSYQNDKKIFDGHTKMLKFNPILEGKYNELKKIFL